MKVGLTVAGGLATALVLAACAGPGAASGTASGAGTVATTGTLTGVARVYGGPLDPTTGKMAANGSPAQGQSVRVLAGSRVVAATTTDAAGRFTVALAPGTYVLGCTGSQPFTVVAGADVAADCVLAVP